MYKLCFATVCDVFFIFIFIFIFILHTEEQKHNLVFKFILLIYGSVFFLVSCHTALCYRTNG